MTAGRYVARAVAAVVVLLFVLVIAPAGTALASTPTLSITSPSTGSFTNNQKPTFSGNTSDSNSFDQITLKIYAGAIPAGTSVQPASTSPTAGGTWTVELPALEALEPGQYTAVAEQTETLETGTSNAVTFTIDTTPPTVSINPVVSPTNNPTPKLEGKAGTAEGDEPTVTVTIKDESTGGNVVVKEGATVTGETWEYTPSHLVDGTYTAEATQKDEAGNEGTSAEVTFTVDTTAPVVSLSPVPSPTNNATPALTGGAGTAEGDLAVVTVTIYKGEVAGGPVATSGPAAVSGSGWSYAASHLSDGTYTAEATQKDEAGNEGTSAEVTFTVDTTPPAVTLSPVASPTNDATPKLEGAGGIAEGDIATATVTVYKGGLVGGTVAATGSVPVTAGSWSYTSTHLEDGTYTAEATQKDEAGNEGTSAEVTFTVDTTAPVVSLSPVPSPTNNATPALTGGAGSAVGDDPTVAVKIYKGTSVGGTAAASGSASVVGGVWSFMSPHLADGTYTAQTTQSDEAGNSGKSAPSTFTVDTTPPLVGIASPANGSHVTTAKPTFSGTAGNQTGDEASVSVNIYAEGNLEQTLHVTRSGTSWTTGSSEPALANGIYTLQAAQIDSAGNTGVSSPATFTVEAPGPEVTLNSLPSFIASATPSFSGTAPATEAEPSVTVKIYNGASVGGPVVASGSAPVNKGEWSFTSSHLANGTYTMQAEQRDDEGHVGHSHASTFKIDTIPPRVTLTLPLGGSSTSGESQLVEGAAGEKPVYKQEIKIKLFAGSNVVGEPAQALEVFASKGAWNATFAGLGPGTYTAQAEQLDEFGFPGTSEPVTFTVKPPPVVTPEAASPQPAVTVSPACASGCILSVVSLCPTHRRTCFAGVDLDRG